MPPLVQFLRVLRRPGSAPRESAQELRESLSEREKADQGRGVLEWTSFPAEWPTRLCEGVLVSTEQVMNFHASSPAAVALQTERR